jgi:phosphopantothenate---cysteine ligase (ATP)
MKNDNADRLSTLIDDPLEDMPYKSMDGKIRLKLQDFCLEHAANNRPIVLVSSGGTAADLEHRMVRYLDNFSTGWRGAVSVEQFVERGYAVIHLWRAGSASPYARVLSKALGLQANHGISSAAMNQLLAYPDNNDDHTQNYHDINDNDNDVQAADDQFDWNTTNKRYSCRNSTTSATEPETSASNICLQLQNKIADNDQLQRAWRQWRTYKSNILTLPFRTVEEYLIQFKECAIAMNESNALAMFYLAAAVSDYYLPDRGEHKLQSAANDLVLTLKPVPKLLGLLRSHWAPNAFVVSFKLETDVEILRRKVEQAVQRYGVHMVIGNILESRHSTVHVWYGDMEQPQKSVADWNMTTITSSSSSSPYSCDLESQLIEFCVDQHFSFLSHQISRLALSSQVSSAREIQERWKKRRAKLHQEVYWNNVKGNALQVGAALLGMLATVLISSAMQKRFEGVGGRQRRS